ncbi:hypothetical protein Y032_0559g3450 [Ancylostoma ceylanicum]|uniref:Uncharacterized protein n=1 Tax=Ancylostoma ceylanicum TaxID=53326 RepID=A0A016WRR5_9BILA|nr:hypothetical protein Y032_0559g3450 [Ancylostoma ceylanicum]
MNTAVRLNRVIHENSPSSQLVLLTLPRPPKNKSTFQHSYMVWSGFPGTPDIAMEKSAFTGLSGRVDGESTASAVYRWQRKRSDHCRFLKRGCGSPSPLRSLATSWYTHAYYRAYTSIIYFFAGSLFLLDHDELTCIPV